MRLLTFSPAAAADLCFAIRYSAANEEEVDSVPFPREEWSPNSGVGISKKARLMLRTILWSTAFFSLFSQSLLYPCQS